MTEKKSTKKQSLFTKFMDVDVSKHTYQKPANKAGTVQLTYLNWSWAYSYMRYFDEDAKLEFVQYPEYDFTAHHVTGRKLDYMNTGNGCYVTCRITIKGETRQQSLPVMDYRNKSITNPTTVDVNKAKQRCFVKCLALFGLGLKLYGMKNITSYQPRGGKYGSSSSNNSYNHRSNGRRNSGRHSVRQNHGASQKQIDDIKRMAHYKVADSKLPKSSSALSFVKSHGVQSTITNLANYQHCSEAKAAFTIDQSLRKLPNKSSKSSQQSSGDSKPKSKADSKPKQSAKSESPSDKIGSTGNVQQTDLLSNDKNKSATK